MKTTHREIIYGNGYTFTISDEGINVNTDVARSGNCDLAKLRWEDIATIAERYHDTIMCGERPGSLHDYLMERV